MTVRCDTCESEKYLQRASTDVSAIVCKVAGHHRHLRQVVDKHRATGGCVAISNGAPNQSHPRVLHAESTRTMAMQHRIREVHLAAGDRESPSQVDFLVISAPLNAAAVELKSAASDVEATDEAHV